jgi:hypothetical protein
MIKEALGIKSKLMKVVLNKIAFLLYKYSLKMGRLSDKSNQHRLWSNAELAKFGHLCGGSVCNVSGWEDSVRDGTTARYRDYFPSCTSYTVTNYPGQRGYSELALDAEQIPLDITKPLPPELESKFDVVLNHTTLEHVYDIEKAADALSRMSKDLLIIVVPFMQEQHFDDGSYGDYWRFTPMAICRLFQKNGVVPLYVAANDVQPWYPIYVFYIGSKHPDRWRSHFNFDADYALKHKTGAGQGYWAA